MPRIASASIAVLAAALLMAAPASAEQPDRPPAPKGAPAAEPGGTGCDPIDPAACMLPFPNDFFTRKDAGSPTGRRVDFELAAMPRNRAGKPIDPVDYNWSDGFSPGAMILARVPGLETLGDFEASGLPPIDDPGQSLEPDSPVVVMTEDGERQTVWAEVDANPADPADVTLIIRPAKNLPEGTRILVGLRDLEQADGTPIGAGAAFDAIRDGETKGARARHVRSVIEALHAKAGVDPDSLFLAWDFTVASAESTTGRMLSIRDRAFEELGDENLEDLKVEGEAPRFSIFPDLPDDAAKQSAVLFSVGTDQVDGLREWRPCEAGDATKCEPGEHRWIARQVKGVMTIPCFLDKPGCPNGSEFAIDPLDHTRPLRIPGNTTAQTFTCNIPHWALRNPGEARAGIYGHGLFGTQGEINQNQLQFLSDEKGFVFCAADWKGMSTYDVPTAALILQDLSLFPALVDHTQQGYLGHLYLGRLMRHENGLLSHRWFRTDAGEPVWDREHLFYDGNSQGGIYGGALTAIAPDFQRAVLGVPGMNYSTLLRRSVDFDRYAKGEFAGDTPLGLYDNYPDELERPLWLAIIQMLWDRADPNGYAQHMTDDPLPNTPEHTVLLHVGFGDHQVADVTTEVQARTIGAGVHRPVLDDLRDRYTGRPYASTTDMPDPWPLIRPLEDGDTGSGVIVWDVGASENPAPPAANVPPRTGRDPHEDPRRTFIAIDQKDLFLRPAGVIRDVCGGEACKARPASPGLP